MIDANANVVRRIDVVTGIITTVAGGGSVIPGSGAATTMDLGSIGNGDPGDSIEEFKIQKSMYAAEFGGKASALIKRRHPLRRQRVPRKRVRIPSRRYLRLAELLQAGRRSCPAASSGPVRCHAGRSPPPQPVVFLQQLRGTPDEAVADAHVFGAGRRRARRQLSGLGPICDPLTIPTTGTFHSPTTRSRQVASTRLQRRCCSTSRQQRRTRTRKT